MDRAMAFQRWMRMLALIILRQSSRRFTQGEHKSPGNPTTQVRLFIIVSGLENFISLPMAPICLRDVIIAWEKNIIRQVAE